MYRNLLFDLDGTLADTKEGILLSLRYGLEKMGIRETDEAVLRSFIGPPLKEAFMEHYGMSEQEALATLAHYRVCYSGGGMYRCRLYPGMEEVLRRLSREGYGLYVATSKPDRFAAQILGHLGVANLFREIAGSLLNNTRTKKQEVIRYLLEKYPELPGSALMIGDKAQDLRGAAACGIPAAGVLYGYGGINELAGEPNVILVNTPEELYGFLTAQMTSKEIPGGEYK